MSLTELMASLVMPRASYPLRITQAMSMYDERRKIGMVILGVIGSCGKAILTLNFTGMLNSFEGRGWGCLQAPTGTLFTCDEGENL